MCAAVPASGALVGAACRDAAADVSAAAAAAAAAAPVVLAVDPGTCNRAIAESAGGRAPLWGVLAASPVAFVRQPAFAYLWALFGCTYAAANLFTTWEGRRGEELPVAKSASIFVVNTTCSLWKDAAFARLFGKGPPAAVPRMSLLSWWVRDSVSMAVIFVGPPRAATRIEAATGVGGRTAEVAAQIALPMLLQPFVAPFHLLGYLLYNDPTSPWRAHMSALRRGLWGATVMRWIRIFPPFSAGARDGDELRTDDARRLGASVEADRARDACLR
eukprot:gene41490-6620_t